MAPGQPDWEDRIGRRLKLRDLHVLAEVVRYGSMAKAANHLAMSQPAVSEAIAGGNLAVDGLCTVIVGFPRDHGNVKGYADHLAIGSWQGASRS